MCDIEIPFNDVNYDSFKVFCETLGHYGPGIKPLSFHEIRVPLLNKKAENTRSAMNDHMETWAKHGCSLLSDGSNLERQERKDID
ncbi:hypothetical protein Ddye_022910 [Dipteronia dyeriana]|uniref:Uncharacterized protein n=1 Tax=Dipteronia dyeriana TaxID=168575 RepID=A0AAD9WSU5_9ROSI|nr:hypothetical protein Ddye_022910 [Dipteronia dyeriana]